MAAPKKVTEMANLANRLIAESATNTPTGNLTAPPVPQPALTVVDDTPAVVVSPQAANAYAIDPATLAPPPAPPALAAPLAAAPTPDGWEHKYNVLKGMMTRAQSDSNIRVEQLENQIGALVELTKQPGHQDTFHPKVQPVMADYGMSEDDIEALGGQEFIDQILRISAAGTADQIAGLRNEINTLRASQTESVEDIFYAQLSAACPSWRVVNKDDRFNEWLLGDEGLSGIAKKNFLENAYENRDAETSARYFNEFLKLLPGSPGLNSDVTGEILPELGGSGPPIGVQAGNIYTPASIQSFFKDKGLGKFKGREAEADAIEKDIFAAQRDGRIVRPRPGMM